jgi:transcriptional regulator with GAF, ATPase, and Fis domain
MPPILHDCRVRITFAGGDDVSPWATFVATLKECGIIGDDALVQAEAPRIVLLHTINDRTIADLAGERLRASGPLLAIVLRRSALDNGNVWHLLRTGADDVFVLDELAHPAKFVAARLQRIAEIEDLALSPVVKDNLVGESAVWRKVIRRVIETARFSSEPILITGESGTGKELVAQLVHTLDPRLDKAKLVVLDCTTVSSELSGSEFFGHDRGAFTNAIASREGALALAHKGTLFLDEVGELPLGLQAELLRAVQERAYKPVGSNTWRRADFRLVCATNRDLKKEEANGNFRLDFYHRIACSHCHLPALRERRGDILPLARHFLNEALGADHAGFDPAVEDYLVTRDYPGNIRELRHLVLRIARRHVGTGPITPGAIPEEDRAEALEYFHGDWRDEKFENALRRAIAGGAGLQQIRDQTVERLIEIALKDAAGNVQRAAIRLGVTDRALQMRRAAQREAFAENGGHRCPTDGSVGTSASAEARSRVARS